jgi:hypothetical protein
MTQVSNIDIPYEELKHLVLQSLKGGSSFQFSSICNSIGALAVKKNIVVDPNPIGHQTLYYPLQKQDENKVREIIWDLITERILTIGDYYNDLWPWFSLTDYGTKAINSTEAIPNDPSGYLSRIKREIPNLDSIIETYLTESIKTYNINQLLSSTITLGCASERALSILIDEYKNSFTDEGRKESFSKKIDGKFIKTQFDEFDKAIKLILHQLPYDLKENYTNTLTGVFQMIRYNRNDAGHPTGKSVDKEILFANLQVFIPYCKFIYTLTKYFKEEKHN